MRITLYTSMDHPSRCRNNKIMGRFSAMQKTFGSAMTIFVVSATVAFAALNTAWADAADVKIERLRTEYLENPLGIDTALPRLSWILAASGDARGTAQSAYQILVASSADKLAQDAGDLWDSGRIESAVSTQIPYAGKPLATREECFWKVRVWDQNGEASAWSEPAHWTMGILNSADWKAKWIGLDGDASPVMLADTNWIWYPEGKADKEVPVGDRYFRRTFDIPTDRQVKRARYLATADNQCKAFINSRDIGGRDNYRTVKDSELTCDIRPGRNLLAVIGMNKGNEPNPAGIVGILTIEFDHGPPLVIRTDDTWLASDKEQPGWNSDPNFNDSHWKPAQVTGPVGMKPWGEVRAPESRRLPARYVRKEFATDKKIRRATVSYSGLGLSELYLNGKKVGDHVLSPGTTEYPKRVLYVTHDVTDQLQNGKNALGAILGNGRYYSMRSKVYSGMPHYGFPKLLLNLHIEYDDGSVQEVVSDDSWKLNTDGPILANNEYDGEEYDARKEFNTWSQPGFDDSKWRSAELVDIPEGVVSAQMIEPIRVVETIHPVKITEPTPGTFIFDMGQNMVGWCQLQVTGPAGTQVKLRHAETLNPDGTIYLANIRGAKVTDIYTLKGGGTETWEPRFTYHGFRFVELTGFPGKPTLETLSGRVVHDDLEVVGQFTCSNELVNQIYKNIVWGTSGNYRSIPTDCPQRDERQGWLGDRSEESKGRVLPLRHLGPLFEVAARHGRLAAPQRQRPRRLSRPLADLFRQRHLALHHGDLPQHAPPPIRRHADHRPPLRKREEMGRLHAWLCPGRHHRPRFLRRLVRPARGSLLHPFQRPGSHNLQSPAGHVVSLLRPPADGAIRHGARQNRRRQAICQTCRRPRRRLQ